MGVRSHDFHCCELLFAVNDYIEWITGGDDWWNLSTNKRFRPSYVNESRSRPIHRKSRVNNDLCRKFCVSALHPQTNNVIISLFVCYSSQLRRLFSWMKKNLKSVALNVDFLFTIIATRKKRMKEKHFFFNETFSFSPIDGKTVFHLFFRKVFRSCVRRISLQGAL